MAGMSAAFSDAYARAQANRDAQKEARTLNMAEARKISEQGSAGTLLPNSSPEYNKAYGFVASRMAMAKARGAPPKAPENVTPKAQEFSLPDAQPNPGLAEPSRRSQAQAVEQAPIEMKTFDQYLQEMW